jgi:hypothetical protein
MTDTDLKIANYELNRVSAMLSEAAKLPPGKERTTLLIGSHTVLLWAIRSTSKDYDPARQLQLNPEKQFQMVMAVFHEYLLDLDSDIEGCSGEDLQDIESKNEAAKHLRTRLVAHVCEGKGVRGGCEPDKHGRLCWEK